MASAGAVSLRTRGPDRCQTRERNDRSEVPPGRVDRPDPAGSAAASPAMPGEHQVPQGRTSAPQRPDPAGVPEEHGTPIRPVFVEARERAGRVQPAAAGPARVDLRLVRAGSARARQVARDLAAVEGLPVVASSTIALGRAPPTHAIWIVAGMDRDRAASDRGTGVIALNDQDTTIRALPDSRSGAADRPRVENVVAWDSAEPVQPTPDRRAAERPPVGP